jgi:hypothetical protein
MEKNKDYIGKDLDVGWKFETKMGKSFDLRCCNENRSMCGHSAYGSHHSVSR